MKGLKRLGVAAALMAAIATPAMAQQEPGAYARTYRPTVSWPAAAAAGVVAGAVVSAPVRDSYAYYGESSDDTYAYYGDRPVSRRTTCGLQAGAVYMGPDGRWYPC
jgi:hypothetical protein